MFLGLVRFSIFTKSNNQLNKNIYLTLEIRLLAISTLFRTLMRPIYMSIFCELSDYHMSLLF
ncbi:hypothetical protein FDZ58_04015 [Ehrlichia ruminantium]|uniref:Uncharacterized protein n=1 Tax=Ehrlichia ruminantium (strain Welgevonden) TaxID=254945 RepID=A0A0H3M1S2_EHRRW|nr:hypothetical protein FDZ68_04010 [Ehrlichia ruminantium]CAI27245.1 Conserved hypothetical protein [Ehrlichia ruminantium str. Welgevonden]QLK51720.1 hypothetical protein FDZ66_04010 [Ehrlichia ruminantium]QLK52642.1 hypothetical protein FDZ65_04000 [Ehrlichia ruminantium]QLK53558.1 hypothetical protein FDZ64_04010 [Ehrlichia ruminantium]